jgi:diadenosine tetraphosphate (Ap4A) HIT family hydrolase
MSSANKIFKRQSTVNFYGNQQILDTEEIWVGRNVIAMIAPKPLVPGHCVIIPKQKVEKFTDLSENETIDLLLITKKISACLESIYQQVVKTVIEDGLAAGQELKHLTVNLIPQDPREPLKTRTLDTVNMSDQVRIDLIKRIQGILSEGEKKELSNMSFKSYAN